ncbi:MAG: hypothetical protein K6T59_02895 [Bryobacteraceae bacterium]|nr:hypothetical protein [Bryobacteraceae bacterium]
MRPRGWICGLGLGVAGALWAQAPSVFDGGVVNAASFAQGQPVAPGSLVSIFGSRFATSLLQADSIPLAVQLADVSVTFNNIPAPLIAVIPEGPNNPAQINAQLPWNVLPAGQTEGMATVVVQRGNDRSQPKQVPVGPFSPGIFAVNFGVGPAIAWFESPEPKGGKLAAAPGSIPGLTTFRARAGDVLSLLATGLGEVDPPVATGNNSMDQLRWTKTKPEVLVGGVAAEVQFWGLSPQFVGVNQVVFTIPSNAPKGDAVPLQLRVGGITSTDRVTIAIE